MKVPQKLYECRDVQSPGVGTRYNIRLQHSTQRVEEEIEWLGMQRWSLLREAPELLSTDLERKALHFLHHPNSLFSFSQSHDPKFATSAASASSHPARAAVATWPWPRLRERPSQEVGDASVPSNFSSKSSTKQRISCELHM